MREYGFESFLLEEDLVGGNRAGQAPEVQEVFVLNHGVAVSGGGAGDCAELGGCCCCCLVVVVQVWVEEVEGLSVDCGAGGDVDGEVGEEVVDDGGGGHGL